MFELEWDFDPMYFYELMQLIPNALGRKVFLWHIFMSNLMHMVRLVHIEWFSAILAHIWNILWITMRDLSLICSLCFLSIFVILLTKWHSWEFGTIPLRWPFRDTDRHPNPKQTDVELYLGAAARPYTCRYKQLLCLAHGKPTAG